MQVMLLHIMVLDRLEEVDRPLHRQLVQDLELPVLVGPKQKSGDHGVPL